MKDATQDHAATILTLSARGQRIRELLYEALRFAEIPDDRAAKGALVLAQVLDREFDDQGACCEGCGEPTTLRGGGPDGVQGEYPLCEACRG